MCSKCHQVFIKTTCFAKVNKSFLYSSKCFSWLSFTFNLSTQSLWWEHLSANSLFSLGPAQLGQWGTPHSSPKSLQLSLGQPSWEGEKGNKKAFLCLHLQISKQTSDQTMPNAGFCSQTQHVYYIGLLSRSDFRVNVSCTKAFPESAH